MKHLYVIPGYVIPGEQREAMRGKGIHFKICAEFPMDSLPSPLLRKGSPGMTKRQTRT